MVRAKPIDKVRGALGRRWDHSKSERSDQAGLQRLHYGVKGVLIGDDASNPHKQLLTFRSESFEGAATSNKRHIEFDFEFLNRL